MNKITWISIGVLVLLGVGALVFLTKKDQVDVTALDPTHIMQTTDSVLGDNTYGNTNSKVVLIEYADYQCGGCRAAHANTFKIKELYKDKVAFVYRNFPITTGHPNALAAATVAQAAGLQGKFWEMNDLLYTNQQSWSDLSAEQRGSVFEALAGQLGINMDQFKKDLTSSKIQQKISTDRALANRVGVNETPTFFVGNDKISNTIVQDVMQKDGTLLMDELDKALKAAGETPPARTN